MFDAVRNNPKVVQIFLAVITLPFAFFGIDAYFRDKGQSSQVAARVGSTEILSQQVDLAIREQENTLRQQMGGAFDRSILDSPAFRAGVLDRLINESAIKATIRQSGMVVPQKSVADYIAAQPEFQENGQFSLRLYQSILASQGRTPQSFEQQVSEQIAQQQLLAPVIQSALTPQATAEHWMALSDEERAVSEFAFNAKSFVGDVKLPTDAAKKYYDANQALFMQPEMVKLEYVVLSTADIGKQISVTEEDARNWYNENIKSLEQPEERRASHILIQVDASAKPEVRAAAKKKAEDLLAKVKTNPAKFAELAKANSDDKSSGERGGDLDYFARGAMVKPFEDAAFSLKPKEISGLVESEFGYHIIMLTDVRGGKTKSFEESKTEAMDNARKQAATKRFAELADQFGNIVYEQPDSLKPAADKFALKLIQTDWLPRNALPAGVLQNQKLQAALFSSESLSNHHNSEAVDLGDGSIVSGRVLEFKAASVKPFADVAAAAEAQVKADEAGKIAKAQGESALGKLKAGQAVTATWKASRSVKRSTRDFDAEARKAVFAVKTDKLPAYVGLSRDQDYVIYRVESATQPKAADDAARLKETSQRYAQSLGEQDLLAYIGGVRERLGVKVTEPKK